MNGMSATGSLSGSTATQHHCTNTYMYIHTCDLLYLVGLGGLDITLVSLGEYFALRFSLLFSGYPLALHSIE